MEEPADKLVIRFGLTEVYSPSSPINVDLVFVHGLNGDPKRTWTSKESNAYWPRDLLPAFVEEQRARILVYGYDADVSSLGSRGVTKDKIHNHAERLIADLFANRRVSHSKSKTITAFGDMPRSDTSQIRKATERPIIFVAHSLGGLVVKRVSLGLYISMAPVSPFRRPSSPLRRSAEQRQNTCDPSTSQPTAFSFWELPTRARTLPNGVHICPLYARPSSHQGSPAASHN